MRLVNKQDLHREKGSFKKLITFFLCSIISFPLFAREKIEMAYSLRASGKIYVVVATVVVIFAGIVIYLIKLDRKISQLERKQKENENS